MMLNDSQVERVTQGIPSLLPKKRQSLDTVHRTRQFTKDNLERERKNDFATVHPDGDVDTTDSQAQMGVILHSTEVIKRLELMNKSLVFEVSHSNSSKLGIYQIRNDADEHGNFGTHKRFICGMEHGYMPEFSIRHYEDYLAPSYEVGDGSWRKQRRFTKETRGWRTVLARLLRVKLVREAQIRRYFTFGRVSSNWKELTT